MLYRYREFDNDCWEVYAVKDQKRTAYAGTEDFAQEIVDALNAGQPDACRRCEQVREIVNG